MSNSINCDDSTSILLRPIGYISSCFRDKFGIPRQPGLSQHSRGVIHMVTPYAIPQAFDGLQSSSHIWIQFIFHHNKNIRWKPQIKPPRLGGNKHLGVFATRSPTRPNALGLSVAKLDNIDYTNGVAIHISGHDLLDGTPVLDIKPYVPYADAVAAARNEFADKAPPLKEVFFEPCCETEIGSELAESVNLRELIVEVLSQDPRPAYQRHTGDRIYATELYNWNIQWRYESYFNLLSNNLESLDENNVNIEFVVVTTVSLC